MKLNLAIIQIEIEDGNKEKNLVSAIEILNILKKSKHKPDIVCFPELFTTGYDLKNVESNAENINGPTLEKIINISKNHFIVIGTILERMDEKFFNTAFIIGKNGQLIGKYQKTHLFSPMLEKTYLTPGNTISTFTISELDDLRIGLAICYDLRFPELFRKMALEGAQIIFVPSEFPSPKIEVWEILLRARAIENQNFMIGVNRVGKGKSDDFFGHSIVTNGAYIEFLGDYEEIKTITIDIDSLNSIRESLPLLKDRRSDLY